MTQEPLMSKLACYSVSFKYTIKLCTVLHCDQLANSCPSSQIIEEVAT